MKIKTILFSFALAAISFAADVTGKWTAKVPGDSVSFAVEGQRGKQTYTGAVSATEIKFKREGGQGQPREFGSKRAAS